MPFQLLDIKVSGLRDVVGRFSRFEQPLLDIRRNELRDLGRRYVKVLQEEAPKDTGRLQRGITFDTYVKPPSVELRIVSKESYTVYVLRGTRPHSAPWSALQGWADRHGIPVFLVWRSIKLHGTSVDSQRRYGSMANRFQARAESKMGTSVDITARHIGQRTAQWLVGI